MGPGETSKIAQLVDHFIERLSEVAEDEDWKESEGWVGKWTILGPHGITRILEIRKGKFYPIPEQPNYKGQVEMSEDTFIDLMAAALKGHGEEVFAKKYARYHIRYLGESWLVDSERFRKALRGLGGVPIRGLL